MAVSPHELLRQVVRLGAPLLHTPTKPIPQAAFGYIGGHANPGEAHTASVGGEVAEVAAVAREITTDRDRMHQMLRAFQLVNGFGRAIAGNQTGSPWSMMAFNLPQQTISKVGAMSAIAHRAPQMKLRAAEVNNAFATYLAEHVDDAKVRAVMQTSRCAFTAFNPTIEPVPDRGEMLVWDDCFSFPELLVRVRRHRCVTFRFQDDEGREVVLKELPVDLSELIQHEFDHLLGITSFSRQVSDDGKISIVYRDLFFSQRDFYNKFVDFPY